MLLLKEFSGGWEMDSVNVRMFDCGLMTMCRTAQRTLILVVSRSSHGWSQLSWSVIAFLWLVIAFCRGRS